jgi:hypothetical protein
MSAAGKKSGNQGHGSVREILLILGQRIRSERERKGMSQEGFAGLSGLHRTEVGLREGQGNPTIGHIAPYLSPSWAFCFRIVTKD